MVAARLCSLRAMLLRAQGNGSTLERSKAAALTCRRPFDIGRLMPERRHGDDGKPRAHHAERRFTIEGEAWGVWEDPRSLHGPSLVFENSKVARRVHDYPANWRELSDQDLYALSWAR